jgi:hypothetical protein
MPTTGTLGGGARDPRAPILNVKNVGGPLGGGVRDPGAPTINTKSIDGGPLGPRGGGGSGLHLRFERCFVNLHMYDRQKVILLTGPTYLCLVLLWLTTLSRITGHV